jgi:hypothetical protein
MTRLVRIAPLTCRHKIVDIRLQAQPDHHFSALLPICDIELGNGQKLREKRHERFLERYS